MKPSKALKIYCLLGLIVCAVAGGILGGLLEASVLGISPDNLSSTALFIGSILLCLLILKDSRDQKSYAARGANKRVWDLISSEFRSLSKEIRYPVNRVGLLAYFLWATSQYIILILFADFQTKYTDTVIVMMCGYLLGVAILGLCKQIKDEKMIRAGFFLTITSFVAFFIVKFSLDDYTFIIPISCFFYTMGNAFLSPSMLSLFSKARATHEQGKGFGLIISADSSGFLVGSVIVLALNHLTIELEYVFLISFIVFLISWFPYSKYEQRRSSVSKA